METMGWTSEEMLELVELADSATETAHSELAAFGYIEPPFFGLRENLYELHEARESFWAAEDDMESVGWKPYLFDYSA